MGGIDVVRESARELAARVDPDAIAGRVTDEIACAVFPERADDAAFSDALRQCTRENVRAIVHMLAGRLEALDASPQGALAFADLCAELGVPASTVERTYWVGTARFWQEWFDLAQEASGEGLAPLADLVREPTLALFAYIDHVLESVLSRYDAARSDLVRTRAHLRSAKLAQVLSGAVEHASDELDDALGYRVRQTHLALVLELPADRRVESEIAPLQAVAGASCALAHQEGARTWVAWLGRPTPFGPAERQALGAALAATGARVAVGEPASGIAGLRRTREQALKVAGVLRALEPALGSVLWYGDVRLETLLLADPASAQEFIAEELGPLAGGDRRCRQMRETLLAWLSTGTQAGAAAMLGLHENTVRARIRQAEELLPAALGARRTELQVALRLERVLSDCGTEAAASR
jgi:hypothetical protein